MKKQVHVLYTGQVQGIGFRYTAEAVAQQLKVKGWVKNLRNGQVELVEDGEEKTLRAFLDKINEYFSRYIQGVDIDWLASTGEFEGFGIRV